MQLLINMIVELMINKQGYFFLHCATIAFLGRELIPLRGMIGQYQVIGACVILFDQLVHD